MPSWEKCVWALCWVSLQKQDHLIHSSIHDESSGPELEAQLWIAQLCAQLGPGERGICIVILERKELAKRREGLESGAELFPLRWHKVCASRFPTGWRASSLTQLYCYKKWKVLDRGGDALHVFHAPPGAQRSAWAIMNGVWRKWTTWGFPALRCCGNPPTAWSLWIWHTAFGPHPINHHPSS